MSSPKTLLLSAVSLTCLAFVVAPAVANSDIQRHCNHPDFTKSARIFDAVQICATADVSAAKLKHAANVAAQWLDNDQDGKVDDAQLREIIEENKATLVMTNEWMDEERSEMFMEHFDEHVSQDLGGIETNPTDARDASQEELHHLIVNSGWVLYEPEIFSDEPEENSELYNIWLKAEKEGYYSYDDPTCNAACKVTEFFYLATAAYLNSQADLFSDEMRIKTREGLEEKLPTIIEIMEDDAFTYPLKMWPDGKYAHSKNVLISE